MATWEEFRAANKDLRDSLDTNGVLHNEIWLQSKFCCEYCGIDLLERPEIYRGADSDHILPKSDYPRLVNVLANYAMACASCHKLKGRYDAGKNDPKLTQIDDLTDEQRSRLIANITKELDIRRAQQRRELGQLRESLAKKGLRVQSTACPTCGRLA